MKFKPYLAEYIGQLLTNNIIVLFTDKNTGVVVNNCSTIFPFGYYSNKWDNSKDSWRVLKYDESVTINNKHKINNLKFCKNYDGSISIDYFDGNTNNDAKLLRLYKENNIVYFENGDNKDILRETTKEDAVDLLHQAIKWIKE